MTADVVIETLQHHQHMRPRPETSRVDGDRKTPHSRIRDTTQSNWSRHICSISRGFHNKTVAVRGFLDEQHRRQIVEIPAWPGISIRVGFPGRALAATIHSDGFFRIIDLGPTVRRPARNTGWWVVVHQRMVVLDAALEQTTRLVTVENSPPRRPTYPVGRLPDSAGPPDRLPLVPSTAISLLARHRDRVFSCE